ncbi:MAG: hypothetical protein JXA95_12925 [Spirochaetales bacterium]|nr:hypothetical protein [Spirochaetales bacterium]
MSDMGKINYYLAKNTLPTMEGESYVARIDQNKTLRQDDIVRLMVGKNTTVTRQDVLVVLDLLKETVKEQVLLGNPVIMELFRAKMGLRGIFDSTLDEFDSKRHTPSLNFSATKEFRNDLIHSASFEKMTRLSKRPEIQHIFSFASRAFETEFSVGSVIQLHGSWLKPAEGLPEIFLRREGAAKDDLIPVDTILTVSDQKVMCRLPDGAEAGTYHILISDDGSNDEGKTRYKNPITLI